MNQPPQPPEEVPQPSADRHETPRLVDSNDLLQGTHEVLIRHGNEVYRLRQTRSGKLILHK
ncbi:MAG: hemin uptake protein HemP [Planctomycetaceae bacterium]